jgi:hypothetical protein
VQNITPRIQILQYTLSTTTIIIIIIIIIINIKDWAL